MEDLRDDGRLEELLAACRRKGADYADCRLVRTRHEGLRCRDGHVESASHHEDLGVGLRVLVNGAWGFAGNPDLDPEKLDTMAGRAMSLARASAMLAREPVRLAPTEAARGRWSCPVAIDPFDLPLEEKIGLLLACDAAMARAGTLTRRTGRLSFRAEEKLFLSTEGHDLHQRSLWSGALVEATAVGEGRCEQRSYPSPFRGRMLQGGWERIEALALEEESARIAREAIMLLRAPDCPSGRLTLVLGKSQLALQVHESCGHATELDRVFGAEANFAGTTFLLPEMRGSFRYGSPLVHLVADATTPGGAGSFGWDDEGVAARSVDLVREGVFVGYQSGRDTAARLGEGSSGAMRARSWNDLPLVRMGNVHLLPGTTPYDELIEGVDDGILVTDNVSWSIDDRRLDFQFAGEMGWRIRKGRIAEAVRRPVYRGRTPAFWAGCDAVADGDAWELWGTPNCGKGQPSQVMAVGHGVSYARFRDVEMGATR